MVKFCCLAFGLYCVLGVSQAQYNPIARIFDKPGCKGDSLTISTEDYTLDLAAYKFDNRAQSASVRGVWLFYEDKNFNLNGDAKMDWKYRNPEECFDMREDLKGIVSSIKFAGTSSEYVRQDVLTLYGRTNYQGNHEEYIDLDTPKLDLMGRIGSFIITGLSEWTFYPKPNFGGDPYCLGPAFKDQPQFIDDTINYWQTLGQSASVRVGCHSKKVARYAGFNNLTTGAHCNKTVV